MNERLGKLIERLHAKTERGEIPWKKVDSAAVDGFEASFPNYTVEVARTKDQQKLVLRIYNQDGDALESVFDYELRIGNIRDGYDVRFENLLHETYQMARRIALGTEKAIDELISVLTD
jgi:hypothetical protein